ncbi:MAG: tetratricopeptide repeat protein [Deltaproteobacteria bacterium]|nr:MAG: tetratricopeptide repeat protein [Deltaproteobacteria bacterium]
MKKKKLLKQRQKQLKKKVFTPGKAYSLQLFNSGRLLEAASESATELKIDPRNAEALYVQGLVAKQQGQKATAVDFLNRAVSVQPFFAEAYFALGSTQHELGAFEEAVHAYQKILSWGIKTPVIFNNLGNSLKELGALDKSIIHYKKAIQLDKNYYLAFFNMGIAYHIYGQLKEAAECFQKALAINADYYLALDNLGTIYDDLGKFEEAVTCYKKSIKINNNSPVSFNNLANAQKKLGLLQEARDNCRKALQFDENFAPAHKNMGTIYHDMGKAREAVTSYRKSLSCEQDHKTHSNLLFTLNYLADVDQEEIFAESQRWQKLYASNISSKKQVYENSCEDKSRLRIGYVSPDFCDHSVSYFIEPVIRSHSRTKFKVFCYANVKQPDTVTERLQNGADCWRDISHKSDQEVKELIRTDKIDILVDLAGHTAANRLLVFAYKPAPIQVTWLGHPNTTGLDTIDYRLTDAIADPPGKENEPYTEKLIHLDHGFLCYQPDASAPEVTELPCLKQDYITFGSFNNLTKCQPEVIKTWAKILSSVKDSHLVLKAKGLEDTETRENYLKMFTAEGVVNDRIELLGTLPQKEDHLKLYNRIDIGLDPFPYNGTTTTCEALWMGVPVITISGNRHSGRVGADILQRIGLKELVAASVEEYVSIARTLADDRKRLQEMRSRLRDFLQESELMDRQQFTKTLEATYEKFWSQWCDPSNS